MMSWRPGSAVLPWLKMMTPSAPALVALTALSPNAQAPRWMSAMSAGPDQSGPTKSAASQPEVEALPSPRSRSTGITFPLVTTPEPEYCIVWVSMVTASTVSELEFSV